MPLKKIECRVSALEAGRTLAALVKGQADVSHSISKGAIADGRLRLNGHPVRDPAHRVKEGDLVSGSFDPDEGYRGRSAPARLTGPGYRVVLEDRHLLVVDKQAGVITVPAPGHELDSLADRLVEREGRRGVRSPHLFVIHRIDRFTSGLVLFARSAAAAGPLLAQFARRTARREYLAICRGVPDPPERRIESFLEEDPRTLKMKERRDIGSGGSGGGGGGGGRKRRKAITRFRVEEALQGAALLRVTLETGRRNQIRVQLAGIGHPLLGDSTYGEPGPLIDRVALHAARLGFTHPVTGAPVGVESPLPDDMRKLLRRLRKDPPPAR